SRVHAISRPDRAFPCQSYAARKRRELCRGLQTIRLLEERQQSLDVVGFFQEAFGIPLTVGYREEVAAIHVDGARQPTDRIDDGVDDVGAEWHRLPLAECFGSGGLDAAGRITGWPPPKDVVFAARVDADDRPHPMVMGELAHPWSPNQIENRELWRPVERVDPGSTRLSQGTKDLGWSGHGAGNDLKNSRRPASYTGVAAIGNETVRIEHAGPSFCPPRTRCSRKAWLAGLPFSVLRVVGERFHHGVLRRCEIGLSLSSSGLRILHLTHLWPPCPAAEAVICG